MQAVHLIPHVHITASNTTGHDALFHKMHTMRNRAPVCTFNCENAITLPEHLLRWLSFGCWVLKFPQICIRYDTVVGIDRNNGFMADT